MIRLCASVFNRLWFVKICEKNRLHIDMLLEKGRTSCLPERVLGTLQESLGRFENSWFKQINDQGMWWFLNEKSFLRIWVNYGSDQSLMNRLSNYYDILCKALFFVLFCCCTYYTCSFLWAHKKSLIIESNYWNP